VSTWGLGLKDLAPFTFCEAPLFLDPNNLSQYSPVELLQSAAKGHVGLDHRFLRALLERKEEALPALVEFSLHDHEADAVDLAPELIAFFRQWKTPEAIPFLIRYIREDPEDVPDEVVELIVDIGAPALEPLLALYEELEESESGEVAFILANLRIRDDRILRILAGRLEYDLSDSVLLLGMYGDPAVGSALDDVEKSLTEEEPQLKKEIAAVREALGAVSKASPDRDIEDAEFDIFSLYPEKADIPVEVLNEDERVELLTHSVQEVRAAAANSFFNRELSNEQRRKLLDVAQHDTSAKVRARAWEALTTATEETEVVGPMLSALRRSDVSAEERGGLLVGLASEADRNEVRAAMNELYENPEGRAKALEAMWRSMHPSFREKFAKHLDDTNLEVRRSAVWGVGYYGIRSEMERLRKLFEDEDLRSDALFAYALAIPSEVSRGRMNGLLARIENDARGLSEMEEELVKAALDERLMLAGKEPFFAQQED